MWQATLFTSPHCVCRSFVRDVCHRCDAVTVANLWQSNKHLHFLHLAFSDISGPTLHPSFSFIRIVMRQCLLRDALPLRCLFGFVCHRHHLFSSFSFCLKYEIHLYIIQHAWVRVRVSVGIFRFLQKSFHISFDVQATHNTLTQRESERLKDEHTSNRKWKSTGTRAYTTYTNR